MASRSPSLVPIALYERWKRAREVFFERLEQIAEGANLSEEEATDLADEAVQTVRHAPR